MITYLEFVRLYGAYSTMAEAIALALAPTPPAGRTWTAEHFYFGEDEVEVVLTHCFGSIPEYFHAHFATKVMDIDLADAIAVVKARQAMELEEAQRAAEEMERQQAEEYRQSKLQTLLRLLEEFKDDPAFQAKTVTVLGYAEVTPSGDGIFWDN